MMSVVTESGMHLLFSDEWFLSSFFFEGITVAEERANSIYFRFLSFPRLASSHSRE
jgi:hypothetical protein